MNCSDHCYDERHCRLICLNFMRLYLTFYGFEFVFCYPVIAVYCTLDFCVGLIQMP